MDFQFVKCPSNSSLEPEENSMYSVVELVTYSIDSSSSSSSYPHTVLRSIQYVQKCMLIVCVHLRFAMRGELMLQSGTDDTKE